MPSTEDEVSTMQELINQTVQISGHATDPVWGMTVTLGVPMAAGILYPFFGLLLSPVIANAAMTFSSLSPISNALRLRHIRL